VSTSIHAHRIAPGELALVHGFLNTTFADGSRERFDTPERLRDWLTKRALVPAETPVSRDDFNTVLALRSALRAMLGSGDDRERLQQLGVINAIVERVPLVLQFDAAARPRVAPSRAGVQGAVGHILAAIATGEATGAWSRLKQCRNRECQRIFYDGSKNHSAVWCSSQRCGNRMAARAYRARSNTVA